MSRTRRTAKDAGTRWETAVVDALIAHGWPHAERRRLAGAQDKGDVAGIAGVCIEAKDAQRHELAAWVEEAAREGTNAGARLSVAWAKRRGKPRAEDGYVVMTGAVFMQLLKEAGYQ